MSHKDKNTLHYTEISGLKIKTENALRDKIEEDDFKIVYMVIDELVANGHLSPKTHEPIAWRVKRGSSNVWGYCETEKEADFFGSEGQMKYVKEPLYTAFSPRENTGGCAGAFRELYEKAEKVCFLGRTTGGTAGHDGELCDGLGTLEAVLLKYAALTNAGVK